MAHTTTAAELEQMRAAVRTLLARAEVQETIARLEREVPATADTFVWSTLPLDGVTLPAHIRSGFIFVLKADTPSGAHHHPNSVQHMLLVRGRGRSCVGDASSTLTPWGWTVIPEGVAHEFFPEGEAMVVVSFHTCAADELEEVAVAGGASRHYA